MEIRDRITVEDREEIGTLRGVKPGFSYGFLSGVLSERRGKPTIVIDAHFDSEILCWVIDNIAP